MMSAAERRSPPPAVREVDPLLKDLSEKKQSFRRNVASLAAELKEVRGRLASQEECFSRETRTRQEAETKAKMMEEEMSRLHSNLEEKAVQLKASTSAAQMYAKELDDLRLQLSATKAIADASALSAQTAQLQCSALVKDLEEKNFLLKEHELRVSKLGEQLDLLMEELRAREFSQTQLKDEVSRIEHDIMQTMANGGLNKDNELGDGVCPRNLDKIDKLLTVKDDEFAKLRDEIKILSAHWNLKTKEMESQLEKQRRVDQELKKKVLKLEFCLHEARAQTRKLQRMGERSDKALKELREQLADKKLNAPKNSEKQSFWETSGFKIAVSVSMLVLVMLSKR